MTTIPPTEADRARILKAHDALLRGAAEFLAGVEITVEGKPGQVVAFALAARVIQIGCALQELLERGYGRESFPLARSMLTGMIHMIVIVDGETDGRARTFILDAWDYRERLLDRALSYEFLTAEAVAAEKKRLTVTRASLVAQFDEHGVQASRLGKSPRTWHGLNTEADLFKKMRMPHIYDLDYAWLSNETHVNIGAIELELQEAFEGKTGFGPKGHLPPEVLLASSHAIPEVLAQLSNLLGLNRHDEAVEMQRTFRDELWGASV